ncbi:MAG: endo-1,4-beta-xylanase [Gemmatimonadota bacterium]
MRATRRVALSMVLLASLAACGGGDVTIPGSTPKTCVDDPTQTKCITTTTPNPDSTLRIVAAKTGRYVGASVDALFGQATYNAVLSKEFSMLVAGNAQKWDAIHPARATFNYARGDAMLAFAQANGMKMRGHTLVWLNSQMPSWLINGGFGADTLAQILKDHITSVVGHYRGTIYAWDVVNESFTGNGAIAASVWSNTLGKGYIETAFRAARAADPAALLFYNDYNLEYNGAKQDSAAALIADFKARGVPIDGIGFQAHFQINADGSGVPDKAALTSVFQRFANLGMKIHLTELDVRIRTTASAAELAAQTKAWSDITGACMAVPACEAIVVWGITDTESWVNATFPGYGSALLFDGSFGKKASYTAVKTAIGG